jgi:hypothetical protein
MNVEMYQVCAGKICVMCSCRCNVLGGRIKLCERWKLETVKMFRREVIIFVSDISSSGPRRRGYDASRCDALWSITERCGVVS